MIPEDDALTTVSRPSKVLACFNFCENSSGTSWVFSAFCGTVLLYFGEPDESKCELGVGLVLTAIARPTFIPYDPGSDMILTTRFQSKMRSISIVECYASTETSDTDEKEAFRQKLNAIHKKFPQDNMMMVTFLPSRVAPLFLSGLESFDPQVQYRPTKIGGCVLKRCQKATVTAES